MSTTITLKKRIEDFLWHQHLTRPGYMTATEIAEAVSKERTDVPTKLSSVASALVMMCDAGHVERKNDVGPRGGYGYKWRV